VGELGAALALGIVLIILGIVPYLAGRLGATRPLAAVAVYGLPVTLAAGGTLFTILLIRAAPEDDVILATPALFGVVAAYYVTKIGQSAFAWGQERRNRLR
jgi:hypothetical protein